MRKTLTKEITSTTVRIAKMVITDGQPTAEQLPDEVLLGNLDQEKAQKEITKKHGAGVTVFGVEADTKVYEMSVEKFLEHATLKVNKPEADENGENSEGGNAPE